MLQYRQQSDAEKAKKKLKFDDNISVNGDLTVTEKAGKST